MQPMFPYGTSAGHISLSFKDPDDGFYVTNVKQLISFGSRQYSKIYVSYEYIF